MAYLVMLTSWKTLSNAFNSQFGSDSVADEQYDHALQIFSRQFEKGIGTYMFRSTKTIAPYQVFGPEQSILRHLPFNTQKRGILVACDSFARGQYLYKFNDPRPSGPTTC